MSDVSIVIPIYNAGKKLEKCIKSILDQTFANFELILVNDGSKDNSLKICKKYQRKDKRVTVIHKENGGSIAARRTGVEAAKSEYVMFVDADDWISKKMVEILYEKAINHSADITVCNTYKVLGNGSLIKQKNNSRYFECEKVYGKEQIKKELVVAYFYGHPFPATLFAKLYKKELLINSGKYLKRITFLGEDLYYNLEIFLKADRIAVINKPLYFYRLGGFTSKYMSYFFDDMVNGYKIQKEVIEEAYQDTAQTEYKGISIMLLNMFKTSLYNLFNSNLSKAEIKRLIDIYVRDESIREALKNKGSIDYFPREYLNAIENKEIEYLFNLGQQMYKNERPKKAMKNILAKIAVV